MDSKELIEKILNHEFPDRIAKNIYAAEEGFAHDTYFVEFDEETFVV